MTQSTPPRAVKPGRRYPCDDCGASVPEGARHCENCRGVALQRARHSAVSLAVGLGPGEIDAVMADESVDYHVRAYQLDPAPLRALARRAATDGGLLGATYAAAENIAGAMIVENRTDEETLRQMAAEATEGYDVDPREVEMMAREIHERFVAQFGVGDLAVAVSQE